MINILRECNRFRNWFQSTNPAPKIAKCVKELSKTCHRLTQSPVDFSAAATLCIAKIIHRQGPTMSQKVGGHLMSKPGECYRLQPGMPQPVPITRPQRSPNTNRNMEDDIQLCPQGLSPAACRLVGLALLIKGTQSAVGAGAGTAATGAAMVNTAGAAAGAASGLFLILSPDRDSRLVSERRIQ